MAERVIKISNILCEIFDRALFVKHSIISVLITRNGVTEVIPQIGSIIYMLNNNGPKIEPRGTRNVNVPVMISYYQFGCTEGDHITVM